MTTLNLYPEDFAKWHDWTAVCDQLNIPHNSTSVELKISKIHYEEEGNSLDFYGDKEDN
jgi:hypothetical protein